MPREISIDVRMIRASGIGTYLQNIIPLIVYAYPNTTFNLLCYRKDMETFKWIDNNRINLIECNTSIYSISEQIELNNKIPKSTSLFWSPHYNIPILYRGKLLVTIHDIFHLAMPQFVGGIHKKIYAKFMFNSVNKKADAIILVSNYTKSEYQRLISDQTQVLNTIYHGVDNSWYNINKGEKPYKKPYILFVGNVKPHKNINNLLKAFASIIDRVSFDLVIIGKKEGFITGDSRVMTEADRDKLKGRVHFTGYIEDDLLRQYYIHAEAMVFPSLYEGFGLPPLEAMACECPVIVSNIASLPEVCGDAVLYCDPYNPDDIANRILDLTNTVEISNKLKERGLVHVRQFSWEKCADETIAVIEELNSR